ncbi:MAG: SDR family oxidoreductase [Methanomassiliicoccales archaeon]|nr:MAG: SDR family oxidoreductase [Methanomassiliicoccales archaeon]
MIEDRNILITGGGGFIGSNLAESLSKKNKVTIIDNLSTGIEKNIEGLDVELVEGSITDLDLLMKVCSGKDFVFHLAALPSVPRSVKEPKLVHEVNATGTLNVLIASRDADVNKVVYASSSSVYGDSPTLPKVETMLPNPLSPYAVSKLIGEYYCNVFSSVYGLPTVSVRYFNVYGPKQNPKGEYAAVIPKFIHRIMNNSPPIIYGDGEQTRDFTYVKDTVRGTILASETEGVNGVVINIATGNRITINELARKIGSQMGFDIEPVHEEPRDGDILHSLADISQAEKLLGYQPKYRIDDGLEETISYFIR